MSDAKISDLADGAPLQATDIVVIARSGQNYKLTGTELGAGFQPADSDLTSIAALDSSTSGAIASDGAGWIKKTYAQFKTALTLVKGDVGLGSVDNTADAAKSVASAAILTTARTIDGQSFDGSANVTVIAPGTHAATAKTTPVDADEIPIVDSAASNVLKKLTGTNLKVYLKTYFDTLYTALGASAPPNGTAGGDLSGSYPNPTVAQATKLTTARAIDGQNFDGTAAITVIAPGTHAATSKTTPVDADELALVDTEASNVLKKLTGTNLKAYLKTYFDTLYLTKVTTRSVWVSAYTGSTQDGSTQITLGTAPDSIDVMALADAATQGVYSVAFAVPKDATASQTLNIRIVWVAGSTDASSHAVRWSIDSAVLSSAGSATTAGTTQTFTGDAVARTSGRPYFESAHAVVTVSADSVVRMNIRRIGADANDTYVGTVNLVGWYFDYTATG